MFYNFLRFLESNIKYRAEIRNIYMNSCMLARFEQDPNDIWLLCLAHMLSLMLTNHLVWSLMRLICVEGGMCSGLECVFQVSCVPFVSLLSYDLFVPSWSWCTIQSSMYCTVFGFNR